MDASVSQLLVEGVVQYSLPDKLSEHIATLNLDLFRPPSDISQDQRHDFLLDLVWIVLKYVACVLEDISLLNIFFEKEQLNTLFFTQVVRDREHGHLFS